MSCGGELARHPQGLDLSHYVALWFGASHRSSSAPGLHPRRREW